MTAGSTRVAAARSGTGQRSGAAGRARVLGGALIVTLLASYAFSRVTGALGEVVQVPVGTFAAVAGLILTAGSPAGYGWAWAGTGRHWRAVVVALAGAVVVVGTYRALGQAAPYEASIAEVVLVPIGEEALYRGFVLTVLLARLARDLTVPTATAGAVAVSALGFGVAHLGNMGYVPAAFLVVQVAVAVVIGLVAGWLQVRTRSLVGPVLFHATVNLLAVV